MKNKWKRILIGILCVIFATIIAILVHALMPGPGTEVIEDDFDSKLVLALGFPVVASLYFVVLYLQMWGFMGILARKSKLSGPEIGFRFGISFAAIYIVGMQEVILSSSPFTEYGKDFFLYQLSMGLGDGIPVVLLCLALSALCFPKENIKKTGGLRITRDAIVYMLCVSCGFFTQRIIGYIFGYIDSDFKSYPLETILWALTMGATFGIANILISPVFCGNVAKQRMLSLLIISINWIWFNLFIGLIYEGLFLSMLLRGLCDFTGMLIGLFIVQRKGTEL